MDGDDQGVVECMASYVDDNYYIDCYAAIYDCIYSVYY